MGLAPDSDPCSPQTLGQGQQLALRWETKPISWGGCVSECVGVCLSSCTSVHVSCVFSCVYLSVRICVSVHVCLRVSVCVPCGFLCGVCVSMCICVYFHGCLCVCVSAHACLCLSVITYVPVCLCMSVCLRASVCVCLCPSVCLWGAADREVCTGDAGAPVDSNVGPAWLLVGGRGRPCPPRILWHGWDGGKVFGSGLGRRAGHGRPRESVRETR